jgi:intracellular sulfur oxidation DsrE/DsrF family protein
MKLPGLLFATLLLVAGSALAATEINPDKPFAEKHVLLQVSDKDPAKFNLTLDIANNLIRHYGSTDAIDIQVVTFAGGINLLLKDDNPNAERIHSLMASDVRFFVCLNSVDTLERKTGKQIELLTGAAGVQTGVAHMLEQIELGYAHIHP